MRAFFEREKVNPKKLKDVIFFRVNYTTLPSKMFELHSTPLLC